MKLRNFLTLLTIMPLLTFCGYQQSSSISSFADYSPLEELGPLSLNKNILLKLNDEKQSGVYRVATFQKNTVFEVSSTDTQLSDIAIQTEEITAANDAKKFIPQATVQPNNQNRIILPEIGGYRLRFVSSHNEALTLSIQLKCVLNCGLAQQNLRSFLANTKANLAEVLQKILPDNIDTKVYQTLDQMLTQSNANISKNRLVVPLGSAKYISMLQLWQKKPQQQQKLKEKGSATEVANLFVNTCSTPLRPSLLDIKSEQSENIKYSYPADWSIHPCVADHSPKLASVMMDLANEPFKKITFQGKKISSVKELLTALMESGHTVELHNEKMYADFLAFSHVNSWLQLPLWIDIGLFNPITKQNIQIPMGHSQHSFIVKGPLVRASVSYYLGMFGTGYFPNLTKRADWTGFKKFHKITDKNIILKLAQKSQELMKKLQKDSADNKTGPFADGYVLLGVCNDSNGILEMLTQKYRRPTQSYQSMHGFSFPYSRQVDFDTKHTPQELDQLFAMHSDSNIADLLGHIPRDFNAQNQANVAPNKLSIFCRVLDMDPFSEYPDLQNPLGARLQDDLNYIRSVVGDQCPKI